MLDEKYRRLDKANMFENIFHFPDQLAHAMAIGDKIRLENDYSRIRNVVFSGMGGSGIGGRILHQFIERSVALPVAVTTNYFVPNWVDEHSLVICFSYSGTTEETLSSMEDALARGARVAGVTSGGDLKNRLDRIGADTVEIPGGLPPRAALGYLSIPVLYVLNKGGLISDSFVVDLESTVEALRERRQLFSRSSSENVAFRIARQIYDSVPVIYGEVAGTGVVALRWRGQLEENGKMLAFHHVLPEMNHNEIVGWENNPELLKWIGVIWLLDCDTDPRIQKRQKLTRDIIGESAKYQLEVRAEGETFVERMFYLIHLGDWVSFWVAMFHETDPTPVDKITCLKAALSAAK